MLLNRGRRVPLSRLCIAPRLDHAYAVMLHANEGLAVTRIHTLGNDALFYQVVSSSGCPELSWLRDVPQSAYGSPRRARSWRAVNVSGPSSSAPTTAVMRPLPRHTERAIALRPRRLPALHAVTCCQAPLSVLQLLGGVAVGTSQP